MYVDRRQQRDPPPDTQTHTRGHPDTLTQTGQRRAGHLPLSPSSVKHSSTQVRTSTHQLLLLYHLRRNARAMQSALLLAGVTPHSTPLTNRTNDWPAQPSHPSLATESSSSSQQDYY
eukprot:GHVU01038874.1.p2 GENE.GHVU01038874.1~~GHVU01038874.1.p2  ORF type:complete len:117 (-),score=7.28 GHVU01038874.1:257-607(-)